MLLSHIQTHPPRHVALQDTTTTVTYGNLYGEVLKRATALHHVSVLAIALDNSVEWVLWDLAALEACIPCVPLPPFFTKDQRTHTLRSAGVTHIITPDGLQSTGLIAPTEPLPNIRKITYTSGTTGHPKGVCLPQSAMDNVASSLVQILDHNLTGIHSCILPLALLLENVAGVYTGLVAGCTILLHNLQKFGEHYRSLHKILKETSTSSIILVPEILRLLMAQIVTHGPLPHLKFIAVGGSRIDPSLILHARLMGLPVYEGYGLSECASVVCLNTPTHDKPGTAGKVLPHVKLQLSEDEIQINHPGFLGYIHDKTLETAPLLFKTGDLGSCDPDGFITITGRRKNTLITSYGRNIAPEWIESLLLSQSVIMQAVVYGDAQPYLSALIVPTTTQIADIQKAINYTNSRLPDYAHIKDFRIVAPFTLQDKTLTGTGRPRRKVILSLYTKGEYV